MPEKLTTTAEREIEEAAANLQEIGGDVTISSGDVSVTLENPRRVVKELCEIAERDDPGTDPWPYEDGEKPVEYLRAENAAEIGADLVRRIRRLGRLRSFTIDYLFRNKKSWEKNGRTVFGQMKRVTGLLRTYSEADYIVLLNWNAWSYFNPMQRVALVYHELRHRNADGKIDAHDFEGFFDELRLFGTRTYTDWNRLAQAADEGGDVAHQYSLSLLDGIDGEDVGGTIN